MSGLPAHGKKQTTGRDDERRLFPTYEKSSNAVPIIPGATFHTPKKDLQRFASLRPVDKISSGHSNIRQSEPVRAAGRSRKLANPETNLRGYAANREKGVSHVENSDIEELPPRPPKRRRRDGLTANSMVENESVATSPVTRRSPRLSSPSSSLLSVKSKRGPSAQLEEYREVERRVTSHRPQNKPRFNHQRPFSFGDDSDEDCFTRNAGKQRRSMGQNIHVEVLSDPERPVKSPKHGVLQSVEIPHRNTACEKNSVLSPIQTPSVIHDHRRRLSDARESPDELQGEATVGPVPKTLDEACKADSRSPEVARKTEVDIYVQPSTSDIWREASSGRPRREKSRHKDAGPAKTGLHSRLFEASLFRFGTVERRSSDGGPIAIYVNDNDTIGLAEPDNQLEGASISLQKVREVVRGLSDSHKIRLNLSSSSGTARQMDIELSTIKDKDDLCSIFAGQDVKVQDKPGEWMDKSFKKSKNEMRSIRYSNGVKRPCSENIPDSLPQPRVEVTKRPKLSASLQNDSYNTTVEPSSTLNRTPCDSQNPQASPDLAKGTFDPGPHSHPPRNDSDSGVEIPVKKSIPDSAHFRRTRSAKRRGPSTFVCSDDDDKQAENGKGESQQRSDVGNKKQKWQKPLVYPRFGKKKAEIDYNDRERLRDNEFLNDNLIGFYLRFLEDHLQRTNQEVAKRVYFFNSYFFATLTNLPKGKRCINYEAVQKWTRNVDIFSHDYVVVPINEAAHWYVAIICNLRGLLQSSRENVESRKPSADENRHPQVATEKSDGPDTSESLAEEPAANANEEVTRQSLASMTLSDKVATEASDNAKREVSAADEDWPGDSENQNSSPTVFPPHENLIDKENSKEQAEPTVLPRQIRKGKKKGRNTGAIDPSQPTIITFDSLNLSRQSTVKALKEYLYEEAKSKRAVEIDVSSIRGFKPRAIPLQDNYSDCGLYLLAYIEKFVQNPDAFIRKLLLKETTSSVGWPDLKSGHLRRRLRKFLDDLYDEQERVGQNKDNEKNTLADQKQISFLLGPPEPNRCEIGERLSPKETPPNDAPEKHESKTDRLPKQTDQKEPLLEERPGTADQSSKEVTTGNSNRTQDQETGYTHNIRSEPEPAPRPEVSATKQVSDLEVVEVPDSQEPSHGQLDSLSPKFNHHTKASCQPDTVVDLEENGPVGKEDAFDIERNDNASGSEKRAIRDSTPAQKSVEVCIPETPPSSEVAQDSPRRSPKYSKDKN